MTQEEKRQLQYSTLHYENISNDDDDNNDTTATTITILMPTILTIAIVTTVKWHPTDEISLSVLTDVLL